MMTQHQMTPAASDMHAFVRNLPDVDRQVLMLHYAELDERINAGIPAYEAALEAAGVPYTLHMYEGTNHAFHNDTNEARYDQEAAELAWSRTIDFFEQHLVE